MCVINTWAEVAKYKVHFSRRIQHSFNRALLLLCYFMLSIITQRFNVVMTTFSSDEKNL